MLFLYEFSNLDSDWQGAVLLANQNPCVKILVANMDFYQISMLYGISYTYTWYISTGLVW